MAEYNGLGVLNESIGGSWSLGTCQDGSANVEEAAGPGPTILPLGNKRTTKKRSSDLEFQNSTLPTNRSWPHLHTSTAAQDQTVGEPLPGWERNFAAALDATEHPSEDEYEDPKLHMVDTWPWMKILPARPIRESEYADTRCFKRVTDTPPLLHTKTSLPSQERSWNIQSRLEEVDKAVSKDLRSHHTRENKSIKGDKTPLPPPRPPSTLRKQHQPLPPEPVPESSTSVPRRHTSPEAQGGPRQISLKDLSRVLGADKVSHDQIRPASSHPSQTRNTRKIPLALTSSSFMPSHYSLRGRDDEGLQACSAQRCQSPASHSPPGNMPPHRDISWRKPFPIKSDGKDIQHNKWYIGQYSRQAVEEALMKENKDGTFSVRDCSTKSKTEPYVLVVFYGKKVYNVKIRFLERSQQFALGTGLRGDEKFDSVEDIIEYYKCFPITLIDGKDKTGVHREQCYLTQPLPIPRYFPPG